MIADTGIFEFGYTNICRFLDVTISNRVPMQAFFSKSVADHLKLYFCRLK